MATLTCCLPRREQLANPGLWDPLLPLAVGEELAIAGNLDTIPFGILDLLDLHLKVDRTHNAIAEHLMDESFDRGAIDQGDFMEGDFSLFPSSLLRTNYPTITKKVGIGMRHK